MSAAACRRAPAPAAPLVPDVSGTREIAGIAEPVRVVRDRYGIAHIDARSRDDLFFAQGFVQAQDRLFQMDLWRRSTQGRLSEVLGPNFAERDAMTRRIQYTGDVAAEWNAYAPGTQAMAAAFVRGVNAWVALARERPPEEFLLAGWLPEPWAPEDLLTRTDAFAESGDALEEILRARIVSALGPRLAAAVLPPDPPVDVPRGLDPQVVSPVVAESIRRVGAAPFFLGLAAVPSDSTQRGVEADDGRRTDVPLDVRTMPVPSARYFVHLRAPGWNVIGATAPWLPGVAVGHNDRVAWSADPVHVDTQDVFIERINPANAHQVEERGAWIDTRITSSPLSIKRRDKPLMIQRERTRHGTIVAVDQERHLAFAVAWIGTEPGAVGDLVALEIDRALNAAGLRAALDRWKAPARRITYVDVDGGRGSEIAAIAPVRRGWNGALPAPGWTGATEWAGFRRPDGPSTGSPLALLARHYPERADAVVRSLEAAARQPDAANAARAILVNALADVLRDEGGPRRAVLFSHPLAVGPAARRRFDIGPLRPDALASGVFAFTPNVADWDRSTAMNAPGQAGSPSSAHYGDMAPLWKAGTAVPLAFSDAAVIAAAEATLTLAPARGSAAR